MNWFHLGKIQIFLTNFQYGFSLSNDVVSSPHLTHKYFRMCPTTFVFWPRSNSHIRMFIFDVCFYRAKPTCTMAMVHPFELHGNVKNCKELHSPHNPWLCLMPCPPKILLDTVHFGKKWRTPHIPWLCLILLSHSAKNFLCSIVSTP